MINSRNPAVKLGLEILERRRCLDDCRVRNYRAKRAETEDGEDTGRFTPQPAALTSPHTGGEQWEQRAWPGLDPLHSMAH